MIYDISLELKRTPRLTRYRMAGNITEPLLLPVNPSLKDYTMTMNLK